jgi:hypothetical protein
METIAKTQSVMQRHMLDIIDVDYASRLSNDELLRQLSMIAYEVQQTTSLHNLHLSRRCVYTLASQLKENPALAA